ncbi:phage integrase family protein [Giesbergeria anulus]|uniref:Site-specific recombinase XerD n=1 Tax=Giesbergeria anulus TaxID=180197 RepID=A0A1H9RG85_9BURK|nr:phage integrase family protein [Giesbergeria anulus]SER71810.1 Site-specific recombinase XerD [Giesbergeria anulus]
MAQTASIARRTFRYTRVDFTALRARLNNIPLTHIANLYYTEDMLEELGCTTFEALGKRLTDLCQQLVRRLETKNPALAPILATSYKTNSWSKSAIDYLVQVADSNMTMALIADKLDMWFKPRVVRALRMEKIKTIEQLKAYIEQRGESWYRAVPRIGVKKAQAIQNWFAKHPQLGPLKVSPDEPSRHLIAVTGVELLAPLEHIASLPADTYRLHGRNRCESFCLISARNDLDALKAYLYKFRGQDKTLKAYRKELERFLLWCSLEQKTQLSSVLTDECEAYKDFLANIPAHWIGTWAPRHSHRWKPFNGQLAPTSQRYAVQVIRACFEWLVKVRYLGGNPWVTVADPSVAQKETSIEIEKALPVELWTELSKPGGLLDAVCDQSAPIAGERVGPKDERVAGVQYRLARAAILLMGFSGLRREEVCRALRRDVRPVPGKPLWELKTLGKRNKWRTVFLPPRVIDVLQAHWADRGHDFEDSASGLALVSPVVLSNAQSALAKHLTAPEGEAQGLGLAGAPFTPDALYQVVTKTLRALAQNAQLALTTEQRDLLLKAAPHAFRHTFGTHAAAKKMPIDVLQRIMGHASIQTTSIYVQAERVRMLEESSKFFAD